MTHARARYLSATHTQQAVSPPLAAWMASQFCTINSSAIMGDGAAHTFIPPLQSKSVNPHCAPHAASTGPVLLQTMAMVDFFMFHVCGYVGKTRPGITCESMGKNSAARRRARGRRKNSIAAGWVTQIRSVLFAAAGLVSPLCFQGTASSQHWKLSPLC